MNLLRPLFSLLGAVMCPSRDAHRTAEVPVTPTPGPRVPRQARRRMGDQTLDLVTRDYPHWRIVVIPDNTRSWIVAAHGAHLIRATSAEETRRQIHRIETAPPLSPVRPYAYGR